MSLIQGFLWCVVCVGFTCTSLSSFAIHPPTCLCLLTTPLCVSVPPHDVKRMAWNSTGNSSCPDSELSQSSMPPAPLGSNTVAAINNTKQSKNTVLTNLTSALPCRLLTVGVACILSRALGETLLSGNPTCYQTNNSWFDACPGLKAVHSYYTCSNEGVWSLNINTRPKTSRITVRLSAF